MDRIPSDSSIPFATDSKVHELLLVRPERSGGEFVGVVSSEICSEELCGMFDSDCEVEFLASADFRFWRFETISSGDFTESLKEKSSEEGLELR